MTEERGKQVLWVGNINDAELVRHYFQKWQTGELENDLTPAYGIKQNSRTLRTGTVRKPVTVIIIVFSLMLTGLIYVMPGMLNWLSFVDPSLSYGWLSLHGEPVSGADKLMVQTNILFGTLFEGQPWRLLTPIFLHFSFLHIAFNAAMFWFFGQRIEVIHGSRKLIFLLLGVALASNLTQYYTGGIASLFGGLSGVVYGLIGFCWIRAKEREDRYGIPGGIYFFMIGWLILGYAGILGHLGLGMIANGAHAGGLIAGMIAGFVTAKKRMN